MSRPVIRRLVHDCHRFGVVTNRKPGRTDYRCTRCGSRWFATATIRTRPRFPNGQRAPHPADPSTKPAFLPVPADTSRLYMQADVTHATAATRGTVRGGRLVWDCALACGHRVETRRSTLARSHRSRPPMRAVCVVCNASPVTIRPSKPNVRLREAA